jgi:hypothetical protein
MKVLATLLLSLSLPGSSLPGSHLAPALNSSPEHKVRQAPRKGGRWYFAENGHAVYCYGPVKMIPLPEGGIQRVATFCSGEKPIVPLKD